MRLVLYLAAALSLTLGALVTGTAAFAQPADSTSVVELDSTAAGQTPQRDIFDVINEHLLKRRVEPSVTFQTGLSWALLPTFSYNPVYGLAIGALATGAGQRSTEDPHYSSLSLSGNYSTTGQIQAQVRGDVFSRSGDYLAKLDARYLDTERSTWGLGPMNSNQQEYSMNFKLLRGYFTVYRVTSGPVFVGLGYHYDEFRDIVDQRAELGESTPFTEYSGGAVTRTVASGFLLSVLGDTRDNPVNPSSGYYLSANFDNYTRAAGSDKNWQEMWTEMRVYPHVPKRSQNVLAFWLYTWFTFGPAPYLNLPTNGWDTYGRGARGYLQGRIRGQDQVYLEAEYRWSLRRDGLLGAVVFINSTTTTDPDTQIFGGSDLGGGAGLRIKFNKRANTNLAIDFAWGRQGSRGLFLGMSEVF